MDSLQGGLGRAMEERALAPIRVHLGQASVGSYHPAGFTYFSGFCLEDSLPVLLLILRLVSDVIIHYHHRH